MVDEFVGLQIVVGVAGLPFVWFTVMWIYHLEMLRQTINAYWGCLIIFTKLDYKLVLDDFMCQLV